MNLGELRKGAPLWGTCTLFLVLDRLAVREFVWGMAAVIVVLAWWGWCRDVRKG